jgi:peroxiredoxin
VIVSLWASWCEPCLAEMSVLREFYHQHEDEGVEVIALSMDRANDKKAVQKIAAKTDVPVAMAVDAKENDFTSGTLPVTYIISRDGSVKAVIDKPVTAGELEKVIKTADRRE